MARRRYTPKNGQIPAKAEGNLLDAETKFLHDLATPVGICKIMFKRMKKEIAQNPECIQEDMRFDFEKWISKAMASLETIEELYAGHKNYLFRHLNKRGKNKLG